MYRRVFVKGPMSSSCVIVARVCAQQMAQMRLAIDNDMVHAFAANGPNQSFGKTVLPRRARRDRFIPNAHYAEALPHDGTEDAVSVADQVPWRRLPRKRLGNLACNPTAVGLFVTAIQTSSRRSSRTMMNP
jgi:hypothetical protein